MQIDAMIVTPLWLLVLIYLFIYLQCLLCVRVPAYSDLSISRPVSISLYVSNGKRKRSSTHCFKYLPGESRDAACLPPFSLVCLLFQLFIVTTITLNYNDMKTTDTLQDWFRVTPPQNNPASYCFPWYFWAFFCIWLLQHTLRNLSDWDVPKVNLCRR